MALQVPNLRTQIQGKKAGRVNGLFDWAKYHD